MESDDPVSDIVKSVTDEFAEIAEAIESAYKTMVAFMNRVTKSLLTLQSDSTFAILSKKN